MDPHITIKVLPGRRLCTTDVENEVPFVKVTVIVTLSGMDPEPITIMVNRTAKAMFAPGLGATLDYRAGVGEHYIEVFVGEAEPIAKSLYVLKCMVKQ